METRVLSLLVARSDVAIAAAVAAVAVAAAGQLLASAGSSIKRPSAAHRQFLKMVTSLQHTFECIHRVFESPVDELNPAVTKRLRTLYPHVEEVMVAIGASLYRPAIIYVSSTHTQRSHSYMLLLCVRWVVGAVADDETFFSCLSGSTAALSHRLRADRSSPRLDTTGTGAWLQAVLVCRLEKKNAGA